MPDAADFDAASFGFSSAEALLVDPQQRLLLEAAAQVLAGRQGQQGQGQPAALGVYVGVASSDYGALVKDHTAPGQSAALLAATLAHAVQAQRTQRLHLYLHLRPHLRPLAGHLPPC